MRIVIAPDSFKESLSAVEVADQIEAGFREIFPEADYVLLPMADGGEGTVSALVAATGGYIETCTVTGPLGAPVDAFYGVTGDGRTAIIEVAAATGLALLPAEARDPWRATSFGVGELISAALDRGLRHIVIGLGGSATNDGGAGMAQALGGALLDEHGSAIPWGGGGLGRLARIDPAGLDPRLADCAIEVACDVDNPLTGLSGASVVFGPQKGADENMVGRLDANLRRLADRIEADLGIAIGALPGAGAAGGMGAGLVAFLGAVLRPGIDVVGDAVGLHAAIENADLVVTGEGRLDGQSVYGKAPVGVARLAARHGVPVVAFAGALGGGADRLHVHGIDAMFSVVGRPCTFAEALCDAAENVRISARNVAVAIKIGALLS